MKSLWTIRIFNGDIDGTEFNVFSSFIQTMRKKDYNPIITFIVYHYPVIIVFKRAGIKNMSQSSYGRTLSPFLKNCRMKIEKKKYT